MSQKEYNLEFDQQSVFEAEQSEVQTPPELMIKKPVPKKFKWLLGVSILIMVMLVVFSWMLADLNEKNEDLGVIPTPLPISSPSVLEKKLKNIDDLLELSSIERVQLMPPPVDMGVEF